MDNTSVMVEWIDLFSALIEKFHDYVHNEMLHFIVDVIANHITCFDAVCRLLVSFCSKMSPEITLEYITRESIDTIFADFIDYQSEIDLALFSQLLEHFSLYTPPIATFITLVIDTPFGSSGAFFSFLSKIVLS